jgi:transposase
MTRLADTVDGVIGVDTHRDTLAAAATDPVGGTLAQTATAADLAGYQRLLGFGRVQVPGRRCWAVEGAGSYGAGLTGFLQAHGELVVEIGRPKRPPRRTGAKSDALDAIRAAREALAGDHLIMPRRRGDREALRVLLATRHRRSPGSCSSCWNGWTGPAWSSSAFGSGVGVGPLSAPSDRSTVGASAGATAASPRG